MPLRRATKISTASRNVVVIALLLAVGCGSPRSDAELRSSWRSDPAETARYMAKHDSLAGYSRARVASILGSDGVLRDPTFGTWSNNCSGEPDCYLLSVTYDAEGRVETVTFFPEGS